MLRPVVLHLVAPSRSVGNTSKRTWQTCFLADMLLACCPGGFSRPQEEHKGAAPGVSTAHCLRRPRACRCPIPALEGLMPGPCHKAPRVPNKCEPVSPSEGPSYACPAHVAILLQNIAGGYPSIGVSVQAFMCAIKRKPLQEKSAFKSQLVLD